MQPGISSDINMFGHVLDIAMLSEGNWEQNKMLQQRNHREHWPKIKEILIFSINSNPKVGGDSKAHGVILSCHPQHVLLSESKTLFLLLQCSVKWKKKWEKMYKDSDSFKSYVKKQQFIPK